MPTLLLNKPFGRINDKAIISILNLAEAWVALPAEQKQHIYSLLPQLEDPRTGAPLIIDYNVHPIEHPQYGPAIKDYMAYITTQITYGYDKKSWQDEAQTAAIKRADGAYDQNKDIDREEYWGQKAVPKLITDTKGMETHGTKSED
ncbi:hypothetical protein K461DRAFT_291180 [Myriangium duriaei CBS 260.36]|uniref:ASX DEUBAD domain-containing protein n=1 Tax=Myriangium duriaei CBS 260.36 TaxID=1168546 RepID=A0A9P4JA47_9PEZI|nr:hypothetical protein K461DRAFT_291180 [Myriangium duriaei CBS 260.36]